MFNYISSFNETDKFRQAHNNGHNYQLIYPNFFLSKPRTILEIGTSSCGFAKFLRDNNIGNLLVGADLERGIVSHHIPSKLTWENLFDDFFIGDAISSKFLDWITEKKYKFDLVIEDASHKLEDQMYLISKCEYLLSDSGVYITEDIASYDNAKTIIKSIPEKYKKYAYITDLTNSFDRPDDICVVIDCRQL
jgi:spermidine synthase